MTPDDRADEGIATYLAQLIEQEVISRGGFNREATEQIIARWLRGVRAQPEFIKAAEFAARKYGVTVEEVLDADVANTLGVRDGRREEPAK